MTFPQAIYAIVGKTKQITERLSAANPYIALATLLAALAAVWLSYRSLVLQEAVSRPRLIVQKQNLILQLSGRSSFFGLTFQNTGQGVARDIRIAMGTATMDGQKEKAWSVYSMANLSPQGTWDVHYDSPPTEEFLGMLLVCEFYQDADHHRYSDASYYAPATTALTSILGRINITTLVPVTIEQYQKLRAQSPCNKL